VGLVSVMVDSREPSWCQQLTFGGVSTAVVMLDAGDLLCATDQGDLLVVERKTCGDFLNSLRDDRLFPQMSKLREVTLWAYLALCGDMHPGPGGKCMVDGRDNGWNWSSVTGALLSIQEVGVHVLFIASDFEYESTIVRLANRDRAPMKLQPPRDISIVSEAEAILSSLPGIGAEKAAALLTHCGTPAMALQILTDESIHPTIPGIGDGIRRKVRKALGIEDGYSLAEVTPQGNYKEKTTV